MPQETTQNGINQERLRKMHKKVILYLGGVLYADMNDIQEEFHLSEKERTAIESILVDSALIKKFSILGITKEGIKPYTLTMEGYKMVEIMKPWYRKAEVWMAVFTLFVAIFTFILAIKN
ncbi:hypothetical protein IPN35_05920 [Candidatus Peregrinibacteria bacterium]|nr:MAG: hypothetical protein IPN35_05920 [Candidatus Peregrinibacteria bacterium]